MMYAQGDLLLISVAEAGNGVAVAPDPDGSVVLARGEATGHRHRFELGSGVTMFRDDALARTIPDGLYIGTLHVPAGGGSLLHEEHGTISLPAGTYVARRQRELSGEVARVVAD